MLLSPSESSYKTQGQGSEPPQPAHMWREHCFWSCGVAKDVVHQLREVIQLGASLARDSVWLLLAPPGVHQCMWEPVCAAALDAMAFGRRMLWAVHLDERPDDPQQTQITRFFPVLSPRRPAQGVRAGRRAAARFWERLHVCTGSSHA